MESQYNHHHQEPAKPEREDLSAEKAEELNNAVRFGTIETVRQLLEKGTDINSKVSDGWTALHSAVQANKEEIVHLLLEKGADPHVKKDNGATPFIIAGITGNVNLLKIFLEKGADINECDVNGFTAFMEAAWYGMEAALRFLYENGADVNLGRVVDEEKKALNKGGVTALMDAARQGHFTLVKALVKEMNADMNICDNQGRNALIHALLVTEQKGWDRGKEDIALFLLEQGVDVNKRDENGKTTLILAVERQSQAVVVAILERNDVDVDDADKNSRTALMVAVETRNHDIAKMLCERGARTDIGNLLEIASQTYSNGRIITLLQKYGSSPIPSQPRVQWTPTSKRWGSKLQDLYRRYRPMIGKLKIFEYSDFRIQRSSQGGVYLGFYDVEAVAVKIFCVSENSEREKTCLEKCRTSNHLVKVCGWEQWKACLYLCLTLCEMTLEEYFKVNDNANMKSKDILKTVFMAVNELHGFGFGHQDLHPSNILIDVSGKVFLADFDKSRKITDDQKDCIISEDLQAKCPEDVADCMEIEDLHRSLKLPDKNTQASEQLGHLMNHPYFWNEEMKYMFLTKVGNESDIKTYKTKHQNSTSEILKALNHEEHPFKGWTTEKVHQEVLDCMGGPFQDKKKPNKNKRVFEDCVTDLLKLIRDLDAHYSEKSEQ
ncbi:hypothetical protein JD844_017332 [Phrynosoma platyrhinos]|uniref:Uncharacterized protein n=1 Tax=Phrynosoma platyrhinos TaxID=52577 RepID=A0ABQ7SLQ5_PHRPL|nr:hypothetical protein JD844_017332 [Phrynosoma platyrhinos]